MNNNQFNHLVRIELDKLNYFPCPEGVKLRAEGVQIRIDRVDRMDKIMRERREFHDWKAEQGSVKLNPYFLNN